MTAIPQAPSTAGRLADLERRVGLLEQRVAKLSTGPVIPGGDVFDANSLTNGGAESGLAGWSGLWGLGFGFGDPPEEQSYWTTTPTDALAGAQSFLHTSPNLNKTRRLMPETANYIPVAPGEVWELQALVWHDHPDAITADLTLSISTTGPGIRAIFTPDTLYVAAANPLVLRNTVTLVTGQVTIPAGHVPPWAFAGPILTMTPDGTKLDLVTWYAKADSLVMRKKLA